MDTKAMVNRQTTDFGCPNETDTHHFVVDIPTDHESPVLITEHYGIQGIRGYEMVERCRLPRQVWAALAEEVRCEFNRRLKEKRLSTGRWHRGENKVERLLGKELLALAWAVELADPVVVPQAIRNWLGLQPEERWWLCTMTAAATGGLCDAGKGWRKALYHALVSRKPISS
jgi:Protein of unknown function (DUF3780)